MRTVVRSLLLSVWVSAWVALAAQFAFAGSEAYQFPYTNPYFATLTARLLKVSTVEPRVFTVQGLPGRSNVPLVEGRDRVEVALFAQAHRAPLMYVVPGVGGTATDGAALWLGEQYYRAGFSAIVLPSPFFWKFVLSQGSDAVPGFTPEDSRDLRRLMMSAKAQAERSYGLRVSRQAAVGYSLGAVNVAFVMKLERAEPKLGLERVIMINPPLHLPYAIAELDRMNAIGNDWSLSDRDALWGYVINMGSSVLARDIRDPNYFKGLDRVLKLKEGHVRYLIGNSFRQTLADTIFLSQQIRDTGLLKTKAYPGRLTPRQNEAAKITFIDYMERAAWPYWCKRLGQKWTVEEFVAQGDLLGIRDLLKNDSAFRLFHNSDDFLTRADDLKLISSDMGERAVVYPYGGHVGNLWFDVNRRDLLNAASDLL